MWTWLGSLGRGICGARRCSFPSMAPVLAISDLVAVDWLRQVGSNPLESFIEPIRNRAESVELHFWEIDDMAKQLGKRKKDGAKADATEGLPPLNLHAAGIDVGSAEHYVAVPPDRDAEPVRKFGSFTADLYRMARWLHGTQDRPAERTHTGTTPRQGRAWASIGL